MVYDYSVNKYFSTIFLLQKLFMQDLLDIIKILNILIQEEKLNRMI